MRALAALVALAALWGCGQPAAREAPRNAASRVDGALLASGGDGRDWAAAGFNYLEQRFSPLTQINAGNVAKLGLAWFADMPDARGQEATPIVIDGKLFVTGPWSKVFAFDAATGRALWSYDPGVDKAKGAQACCDVVNRGVAAWKGRLYLGTLDGRLIALDAGTGAVDWSVQTTDNSRPYTITGVPRVVKDMVVIGNGGAEFGVRGYVTAYDAATGAKKWRFYTVPNPNGAPDGEVSDRVLRDRANASWSARGGQWHESGGGGTVWDAIVYDPEFDQLYLGVGNGSPWNHGLRSNGEGDNLFLSSIVALKPETGEYVWHYQETPGETWDFTATQPIALATIPIGGVQRKVLMQAPKNGFFFVVDRANGKLINAGKFIDHVTWAEGYGSDGRPVENPAARFYRTGKPFLAVPSALAAHNWQPMSFSPQTGLAYVPAQEVGMAYIPPTRPQDSQRLPIGFNVGGNVADGMYPRDPKLIAAAAAGATGSLVAWDPATGKAKWKVQYPTPWNGGTMATAGNLVFQGTALGEFRAYAADTGRQLFAYPTQTGVMAGAATYMVGDTQYVAVLTGRGGALPLAIGYAIGRARTVPNVPRLLVFRIGGTARLPAVPDATPVMVTPPAATASAADVEAGRLLFGRFCQVCHGASAGGAGVLPDLQRSGVLADRETWKRVLIDGMLKERGMVSFARVMDARQAEQVRAYVIDEANWAATHLPGSMAPAPSARKVAMAR